MDYFEIYNKTMGNCITLKKPSNLSHLVHSKLLDAIDDKDIVKTRNIISKYTVGKLDSEPVLDINRPIAKVYNNEMNVLGYSLFLGYTEIFMIILEQGRAKLSVMNELYSQIGKRPIDIICELGHRNFLEYYLPFYMNEKDEVEEPVEISVSMSFSKVKQIKGQDKNNLKILTNAAPAIHKACEKERLGVIQYLYNHFNSQIVPSEFDIHYQDENTGENCALISCKTGNLQLIQYLYNICGADFHILNKRRENAIQIMAVWSKKKKNVKFIECFKFLIEVVSIDYTYQFEETILILNDKAIIDYLKEKLMNDGISIDKIKLDEKYSLTKLRVPPVMDPELEFRLNQAAGSQFSFKDLFAQELHQEEAELSSIINNESTQNLQNTTQLSVITELKL